MSALLEALSWALILGGVFFSITGALGLLRFPELYCRIHAAGLTDTLGATLLLAGLLLQTDSFWVGVKLVMIAVILHVTSPTGTYALVQAAYARGIRAAESD